MPYSYPKDSILKIIQSQIAEETKRNSSSLPDLPSCDGLLFYNVLEEGKSTGITIFLEQGLFLKKKTIYSLKKVLAEKTVRLRMWKCNSSGPSGCKKNN